MYRRVLYQTAIRIEKENALRHSSELCEILKSAIEQFSTDNSAKQQLCLMRRAATAKSRQIKALSAESHVRDNEIKRKDQMLEELRTDLFDKKQILLREKRDKQKLQSQLNAIKEQMNVDDNSWKRSTNDTVMGNPMTYRNVGPEFRCASAHNLL